MKTVAREGPQQKQDSCPGGAHRFAAKSAAIPSWSATSLFPAKTETLFELLGFL
jgi:hypothetical protein